MKTLTRTLRLAPIAALCAAALPALATNGYFPHGYGMKAQGMGGTSIALAQDSMGGATNPAAMVWAGSRLDLGVNWFSPQRDAERSGAAFAPINGQVESGETSFFIPEFGYNRMVSPELALGLTVYGNGGMNTTYPQGSFQCPTSPTTVAPANMLCGSGTLGQDLMQLIVAPTVAYKLNAQHAIGAALLLGYQRFKAEGLQAFQGLSSAPGSVTNNGYDSSTGVGIRLGYQGHLSDMVAIGAAYAPKMHMGNFDKYKGLFAGQGSFDIPAHFSVGIAVMPTPQWTLAADFGRIEYSGVPSVGNPSSNQAPLGADNGPGFGWKSINVFKLGASWRASEAWTLRAGFNRGDNPISAADVSFNIIAPGVMTTHWTAGFTYAFDKVNEITGAAMVAPRQTVTGASMFNSPALFPPGGMGGNETIGMKEMSFGLAWGHKF